VVRRAGDSREVLVVSSTLGRGLRPRFGFALLAALVLALALAAAATATPAALAEPASPGSAIPRPPELQRDVDFWIRIYSEVSTSEGLLHDEWDLSIVYARLQFPADVAPSARREAVDSARARYADALVQAAALVAPAGTLPEVVAAAAPAPAAPEPPADVARVLGLWGPGVTRERLLEASRGVRFQLGQADRFRAGLVRSGTWEAHIARSFAGLGLPPELAALPHVESSFTPSVYSKVGAAGLWQFMPGTGRQYMRVDDVVDERLDPFRSTEAAAQLLAYNYRVLGTWPLALTAYNHGAAGMRRARDAMGTDDFVTIARRYRGPAFGFASRNFYPSFLAALTIDQNPQRYFGSVERAPELRYQDVPMPGFAFISAVARATGVTRATLQELNPALRPPVWSEERLVPRGYRLRLPPSEQAWTAQRLGEAIGATGLYAAQIRARSHKVARGETLAKIARRYGLTQRELAALNGLAPGDRVRRGRVLRLPDSQPPLLAAAAARPDPPVPAARATDPPPTPATAAEAAGPSVGPEPELAAASNGALDFAVGRDDTIRVVAGETLGHYAEWLGTSASRLRVLNGLRPAQPVNFGATLKLDFSNVPRERFEEQRRVFHQRLQSEFFETRRITGTEVYVVRRGDTLAAVLGRFSAVPVWLLQQYNPDVDLAALRAGSQLVVPRVAEAGPG
jgi:membrane-bound lytic murein transglycosylase D